jgi:hypothetical protein
MILSSADILRNLGSSEIIRLAASLKIVDKKPGLSGDERLYVCVSRFPRIDEFQATWTIWLEGDGEEALIIEEIKRLLPSVKIKSGLITELTTTDFSSDSTQRPPEAPNPVEGGVGLKGLEDRFQELSEDISDRMLLVSSGRSGAAGVDGKDGADGKDGRDLLATDAELFDLRDAGPSAIGLKKGQVLTWDGSQWTNLYVPTSSIIGGGGGVGVTPSGSGQGGIEEAPLDGNYYVRSDGKWLDMVGVLDSLGYTRSDILDGGDFTNVTTDATDDAVIDGGEFEQKEY